MKNKKILIGTIVALGLIGTLFYFKSKKANPLNDDETGGNVDFDYNNASGNVLVDILNRAKKKKIIPVKKYQNFLKSASLSEMKKYFSGKNIYTLVNDVNIREEPYVNNGAFNSIAGTVKNKGVFLGKVSYVLKNTNDNKIWFGITEQDSNKFIAKNFRFKYQQLQGDDSALYLLSQKNNKIQQNFGISINWVRADVVVVDLSDERILKDKYSSYYFWAYLSEGNFVG
jgi:hypothetical protein